MSEIKVGDLVEVTKISRKDDKLGVSVGDTFVVSRIDSNGAYVRNDEGNHYLYEAQFRKSEMQSTETKGAPKTIDSTTNKFETLHKRTPDKSTKVKKERVASSHYQNANNNDVWQFADDNLSEERVKGFHQVNAIKYVTRYHIKHDTIEKRIEDLEKAKVYIDKLIELERQA